RTHIRASRRPAKPPQKLPQSCVLMRIRRLGRAGGRTTRFLSAADFAVRRRAASPLSRKKSRESNSLRGSPQPSRELLLQNRCNCSKTDPCSSTAARVTPMLETLFRLKENGTTVRTELVAGATTFLTMAYIVLVNPQILSAAGMDKGAVFVATCIASALATAFMALYANYPLALAPGIGLNAYFTYGVVLGLHYRWQVALGAVFLSGCLFLILSMTKVREWIIAAIPMSQRVAISAGIGLFLGIIALKEAGIV